MNHDKALNAGAWVTPDLPCYAVVGKVNMGKSAILATLLEEDDDRIIRISPEPGETTRCQRLSLVLDGVERLRFIDTPGFQQPIEALRAIRALHDDAATTPGLPALARFVEKYRGSGEFEDECRLLEPLLEGAGILYVVDPGVPVYDSFLAEIEILRFSGRARLAVLNQRGSEGDGRADHEADWRAHLGKAFNLVRAFDAHQARFAARRDLLAALNQIDERDRAHLDTTMALLDAEWAQRRELAAEHIQSFLRAGLTLRERETYAEDGPAPVAAKRDAVKRASGRYFDRIATLEREAADALLGIYRHTAIRAQLRDGFGGDLDLASDETWRRLGLTRQQLTFVGAAVGASAGLGVDAAALGHTLGVGALLGGIGGGALAFFKGEALPELKLDFGRMGALGGRQITLGPPRNPNFAWVLLDSILIRYRQILLRAHARRGDGELAAAGDDNESVARDLPGDLQKTLGRWFRQVMREREDAEGDSAALAALVDALAAVEKEL
ncbi:DUF3482 domain-containing protein [Salinisphaera aquimarina]|uniref:DUF3482 domain-containing protein n=1 Tax=Salinisphaera aquimarina TaxID=2094031 RepID=A0ABV7EQK9_9GAMM